MPSPWERIQAHVYRLQDSCYVYAVEGPEGVVLINAGTGLAADHLDEIAGSRPVTVLLTHHFRDHTDGAIRLHEKGARICGPYWDQAYLVDPEQHFRERQHWNSYDNRWDRFAPVRPVPVDDWMLDYETRTIAGLSWEVVPTPGMTNGASSYVVAVGGRRIGFVGEVICGTGKTTRLAPLQYNYNDYTGAWNLYHAAGRLLATGATRLLPSLGEPVDDPVGAIAAFKANLKRLEEVQPGVAEPLEDPEEDDIEEVLPHLYRSKYAGAETHFVLSDSGKVLSIDYGYNLKTGFQPAKSHVSNRRPILHGISGLRKRFGIDRIDAVLVSHFHDDHVNGIPMLQRLFGTEVLAGEQFSDLLEHPAKYDRPCLWHEPIEVDRRIPNGATIHWEHIPITLYPMSGHTRFATMLCMEIDGTRVVHTGDQAFFDTEGGVGYRPGARMFTNHVYKNGLDLGCYKRFLEDLKRFDPELVITGHTRPYRASADWFDEIARAAASFDDVHRTLMLLDDDAAHFGAESQGGKLAPYRAHAPEGTSIAFTGWVLNPFPTDRTARLQIVGPDGWRSETPVLSLGPREQKAFRLILDVPAGTRCRRQPVALDLTVGGQPFGQVAEALVTVGLPMW